LNSTSPEPLPDSKANVTVSVEKNDGFLTSGTVLFEDELDGDSFDDDEREWAAL